MNQGKLVFSQLMAFLPLSTFRRCVATHRGDHKVQDFTCMDQFLTMAFAQLTYRESLRDIEVNLRAQAKRLYHMGLRCKTVSRNTLSNANATRPWQIYADFAQHPPIRLSWWKSNPCSPKPHRSLPGGTCKTTMSGGRDGFELGLVNLANCSSLNKRRLTRHFMKRADHELPCFTFISL